MSHNFFKGEGEDSISEDVERINRGRGIHALELNESAEGTHEPQSLTIPLEF